MKSPRPPSPSPISPRKENPGYSQGMVFASQHSSPSSKRPPLKVGVKNLKTRLKGRKSTPAPTAEGDGRKRFILSPGMEDKQIRKKISFGGSDDEESPISKNISSVPMSGQEMISTVIEVEGDTASPPSPRMTDREVLEKSTGNSDDRCCSLLPKKGNGENQEKQGSRDSIGLELVIFPELGMQTNETERMRQDGAVFGNVT